MVHMTSLGVWFLYCDKEDSQIDDGFRYCHDEFHWRYPFSTFHIPNSFMNYYLSSCQSRPLINLIIAESIAECTTTSSQFSMNMYVCKADANNFFLP